MKHKDNSPASILMALANNTRYPILLSALHLLGRFLYDNSLERVHGLSRQFRDILERSLMETVQTYLAPQPDDDERKLLLEDWKQLSCGMISHPFENPLADELETDIAVLNCVGDYVSQRETIMAQLAELPEGAQCHVRSCLRSKLTELLFYAVIPQFSGKHANLSAHRFRLWVELNNCIAAGAEGYAMYFLCHDGHALRFLSPWTLTCEASAAQLYQTAYILSLLAKRGIPWDHELLISCFYHLLDTKVRLLVDGGVSAGSDTQALLELYIMVSWTERQEFHNYWELPRFHENLSNYYRKEA